MEAILLCYAQRLSLGGRSPRRCGLGLSRNAALDAGHHGFPASAADRRSEAAPRASPFRPARRRAAREGMLVEGATPVF